MKPSILTGSLLLLLMALIGCSTQPTPPVSAHPAPVEATPIALASESQAHSAPASLSPDPADYLAAIREDWDTYHVQLGKLYRLFFMGAYDPRYAVANDGTLLGQHGERQQWIDLMEILFYTLDRALGRLQSQQNVPGNLLAAHAQFARMLTYVAALKGEIEGYLNQRVSAERGFLFRIDHLFNTLEQLNLAFASEANRDASFVSLREGRLERDVEADRDYVPPGATALCNDGSYSYSQSRQGACSHHGGVARWLR